MNKTVIRLLLVLVLLAAVLSWLGIGYRSSGSAVADLKEALAQIHGQPYTGRETETGTEDLVFSVTPATFFPSNYSVRWFFGWDYRYHCQVTHTVYPQGQDPLAETITYTGIDPMGEGTEFIRAYLELE